MRKLVFISVLLLFCAYSVVPGQSRRAKYDSLIVGDRITPVVSSVMMPKSYTEVILYNSLLTANTLFASNHEPRPAGRRDSFFFNTLQVTHGLSSSGRLNVGIDVSYRTGRSDSDPGSSPLKVFGNSSQRLIKYERAFTSIGLRARYVPFAKIPNLVVQHAFYIPISISAGGREKSAFLGDSRYALNTQLLYNKLLGRKMFLFGQLDLYVRLKDEGRQTDYTAPVNIFATYLLTKHLFPFVQLGASNSWYEGFTTASYSYGAGVQYQFTTMFNLNFFYNDVFAGKNSAQWKNFNWVFAPCFKYYPSAASDITSHAFA